MSNDFFVYLLSPDTEWVPTSGAGETFNVGARGTGEVKWTASGVDLIFGSNSKLRALPLRDQGGPVSPDGRWIAHSTEDSGRFEIYEVISHTRPQGAGLRKRRASWWTRDGWHIVFLDGDFHALWRVDGQPGETLDVGTPRQFATLLPDIVWVDATPDRSDSRRSRTALEP